MAHTYPNINKTMLCKIYNISRSSLYYEWKKVISDMLTKTRIACNRVLSPYYGYKRHAYDLKMNKKKSLRIVQKFALYWLQRKRKFRKPWDMKLPTLAVGNLRKKITITQPHQVWSSDFTHFSYKWNMIFLATVLDEYGKKVVWHSLWFHHGKELVINALNNALLKTKTTPKILHSDQWSEYRSYEYFDMLKMYHITASMSKKSSPWENGMQESFYGKLKFEMGNLNRFKSIEHLIEAIHLYIYYYNNHRIHTTLKTTPESFTRLHS